MNAADAADAIGEANLNIAANDMAKAEVVA